MPVYNCGKFLERNLNSYLNQTMREWELILVDDGSKDNSWEVIKRYSEKDSRIKIIHKENGGCVSARQKGMEQVSGDYLIHVDADDWVEANMLEALYSKAKETDADMVWCDCFCNDEGVWKSLCDEDPIEMIHAILVGKIWGVVWNKMLRTSIAKKYGVVPHNISMWEDIAYIVPCLLHTRKIAYCRLPLYHYNVDNQNSMVHQKTHKNMAIEYCCVIDHIDASMHEAGMASEFLYDMNWKKITSVTDYVDDVRIRDYDKFMNKYPEAIKDIWKYKDFPMRLKVISSLLKYNLKFLVPIVWKLDVGVRHLLKK